MAIGLWFAPLALSLLVVGCGQDRPVELGTQRQIEPDVAAGRTVADRSCKVCHGLDGRGAAPGIPRLAGQRAQYLFASLQEYESSKRPHAAFNAMSMVLTEADARNVAAYYASLPPIASSKDVEARASTPLEDGRALAAACAACHGEDGNSVTPGIPSVAGQQPHYVATAMSRHPGRDRSDAAFGFDALQLEKVAMYFASQTPARRSAPRDGAPDAGSATTTICTGCHGFDGVSNDSSTPNLAGQDPVYLARVISAYRTNRQHGAVQRYMAGLSDGEIADVAAFYATRPPRATVQSAIAARDVAEKCNRCHDADDAAVPILRGQDSDYLAMALRAYRDGRRQSSTMHSMSSVYGNILIESIADWYAAQPGKQTAPPSK